MELTKIDNSFKRSRKPLCIFEFLKKNLRSEPFYKDVPKLIG